MATRIAGHVDVVDDGRSGLLVDGPDAELAGAIEQRAHRPDPARARLGEGAASGPTASRWDRTALEVLQGVAGRASLTRRAPPRGGPPGRRATAAGFVAASGVGAGLGPLLFTLLVTRGRPDLLEWQRSGDFYDAQAHAWLAGRW